MNDRELEMRLAEINAREPEEPTEEDLAAIRAAEAEPGEYITLEDFKREMEGYNGRISLRIPRSLHKKLKESAAVEGVSLNQYVLYKLAK